MGTPPPRARLAAIAAVVLAAHAALLSLRPAEMPVRIELAKPFATRQVTVPARAAPAAAAPSTEPRVARSVAARPPSPPSLPSAATPQTVAGAKPSVPAAMAAAPERRASQPVDPQPQRSTAGSDVELGPLPAPPRPAGVREPGSAAEAPSRRIALPAPARLNYEVEFNARGLSLLGAARLQWSHDSQSYTARLEVDVPLGRTRMQESRGRITPEGLAPQRFADRNRTEEATHFERDKGKLVFSNNRPEADLQEGTQDRLSVIVQVASMIGGDPARFPPGTQIAIPTAGTREAETWVFLVEGEEILHLPGGALPAMKLSRTPRKEYDQKVELWLAPRLDYAPVRVRLTAPNGDSVDQRWASTDKG